MLLEILMIIIAIHVILYVLFSKNETLKKYNISFIGPLITWRTKKGIYILKKIAKKKRFWNIFGKFSVGFCIVVMILMTLLLIWQVWMISDLTPEQKQLMPGPEIAFLVPGLNPILPLSFVGYIIFALFIGIVVHEGSHGIQVIVNKLKVKSLGVIYFIFPLGAFCEPNEEDLKKADKKIRMKVYAAGPASNFIVVLVSIFLLSFVFMSAVQPAADGVAVSVVIDGTPADEIGIKTGMIITSVNDTEINNINDFFNVLDNTQSNQNINISYVKSNQKFTKNIVLDDKYNYYKNQTFFGKGFLGVGPHTDQYSYKEFLSILKNPSRDFLIFFSLPVWGYMRGYNPIIEPFTDSYVITGPLGVIPTDMFWIIVNSLYWIFWLNLLLAMFNVLPIVPLDGGYIFKDVVEIFLGKKTAKKATIMISLIIAILLIFPYMIKYI